MPGESAKLYVQDSGPGIGEEGQAGALSGL